MDDETGLYYHGARYYACWLGRWTSADPLGLQAGLNLYLYGRASPIVFMDPSGTLDVTGFANLGQTVATGSAFAAADTEARSWAPDASDAFYEDASRPTTEYDPEQAAAAMAQPEPQPKRTEAIEPGNMGFGTSLVSPGDLYEQEMPDAENAWRQRVIEAKDYEAKDPRGHRLWLPDLETGEMVLAPRDYIELPFGTSDVEVALALGGAAKAVGLATEAGLGAIGRWTNGASTRAKAVTSLDVAPKTVPGKLDPKLLAEIGQEFPSATEARTILYHGGLLDEGVVAPRVFSTTTGEAHAAQYAAERGGQVFRFDVPTTQLQQWESEFLVRPFQDLKLGTQVPATEYRFRPTVAPELNRYRRGP